LINNLPKGEPAMKISLQMIKVFLIFGFVAFVLVVFASSNRVIEKTSAFSSGPPPAVTGAPGESDCQGCHFAEPRTGQFAILNAPANYTPGQTYTLQVRHTTNDTTRRRWGFQLTALANNQAAGTFANISGNTQTQTANGRNYIQQTLLGSFQNQANIATWSFNWTAPTSNVGPITFYAAGNQANNNGNENGDQIYTTSATSQPPAAQNSRTFADYDGDGKTDLSIFRPSDGNWWINRSSDSATRVYQFGQSTDRIVPADYTGDGKNDVAFFRAGTWFILRSENDTFFAAPFGAAGDIPAPGDFDADNRADLAVFRPTAATWFILQSTAGTRIEQFGANGDAPTVGDYDGDNKADIAIFRPTDGSWWVQRSTSGFLITVFGTGSDKPVQADYTGDGKTDIAFFRPQTGTWFVLRSEDLTFFAAPFGANGDIPVPGNYDGDNRADFAVFRPPVATWFVLRSTQGSLIQQFGANGDRPTPAAYIP
jgi:hypothetical protein